MILSVQWLLVALGIGLFSGFVFPCYNGPFNILKNLRDKIGKPFTCPTCSLFWGCVFAAFLSPLTVNAIFAALYLSVGLSGWGLLLLHVACYNIIYQGMED